VVLEGQRVFFHGQEAHPPFLGSHEKSTAKKVSGDKKLFVRSAVWQYGFFGDIEKLS
jgi:hypothetical protein